MGFKQRLKLHSILDKIFHRLTQSFAIFILILIGSFLVFLYHGSLPAINRFGWSFLISSQWNPITQQFGALVPIAGTLTTSFIALLMGVPTSFGIAVFLIELCPSWLKQP